MALSEISPTLRREIGNCGVETTLSQRFDRGDLNSAIHRSIAPWLDGTETMQTRTPDGCQYQNRPR